MSQSFNKDPEAVSDFAVKWEDWLANDAIVASTWTVPAGIVEDHNAFLGFQAIIWLSGGTVGETYTLINHIVTDKGRTEDRSIFITVKEM